MFASFLFISAAMKFEFERNESYSDIDFHRRLLYFRFSDENTTRNNGIDFQQVFFGMHTKKVHILFTLKFGMCRFVFVRKKRITIRADWEFFLQFNFMHVVYVNNWIETFSNDQNTD